jgi:hypothetical protein
MLPESAPMSKEAALVSIPLEEETEGPRRRLWMFVMLCAYALSSAAIDVLAKTTGPTTIASVATIIYIVFSPVLWIALYRVIRDW